MQHTHTHTHRERERERERGLYLLLVYPFLGICTFKHALIPFPNIIYTVPFRLLISMVAWIGGIIVFPIHIGLGLSLIGLIS